MRYTQAIDSIFIRKFMFFGDSVEETREIFFLSFEKYMKKELLSPLESQIANVIADHPEYHALFAKKDNLERTYHPELGQTNPFLHLGLHLAIRDQVATNRPVGIRDLFEQLCGIYKDPLAVEHLIMEHLAECLWQAQKSNSMPDEAQYLRSIQKLCQR
jgi:hypothetical protein